ncbi:CLAVATA3/ESR (CLE)-related protein [Trifolium repens]|nr:CLAVATA3/ESR (CLE)-related protein [Trifolium repens]
MKMKKVNTLFLIFMILTFVVSLPFVQCSSSTRIYRTNMEGGNRNMAKTSIEVEIARFKNEGVFVGSVEHSEREVPTGPDPLHHNNNPFEP